MDTQTKELLVAVAEAVLRVLAPARLTTEPAPGAPAVDVKGLVPSPNPTSALSGLEPEKDAVVRIWDGNKYVVGKVVGRCRTKPGQPKKVHVRVEKPTGRGKTYQVEVTRCELLPVA